MSDLPTTGDGDSQIAEAVAAAAHRFVFDPPNRSAPVIDHASPAELLAEFEQAVGLPIDSDQAPVAPARMAAAIELVIGRSMHTTHPRFFNQNFAGPEPLAVAGDWLAAALNTTNATFEVAPVFTMMERSVIAALARLAGYPVDDAPAAVPPGIMTPGGSSATLHALQLARHRACPEVLQTGATGERLGVFVSEAGHYATAKSAALMGLGRQAVIEVSVDDTGAMVPAALRTAIETAVANGTRPVAVVATAGTTVTSAFDPLEPIADLCDELDLWLHVDGCWGGSALFSPTYSRLLRGVERSDSMVWNLHKMMGMTQQCTVLLVKDPAKLEPVFSTRADYIFQQDKLFGDYDAGDRTFHCGRRVDVLKVWLLWKATGSAGFADRVDHAVALADHARTQLAARDDFVVLVPGEFTNVCFAWIPPELRPVADSAALAALSQPARDRIHEMAPRIKARMQQAGTAMVGVQPVHGVNAFRLLFANPRVTAADVDAVLDLVAAYGAEANAT